MQIKNLSIPGVLVITPGKHGDDRGFFSETFRADTLAKCGIRDVFVQDNQAFSSRKGVVRGLHFQVPPHAQGKLVRCTRGSILDVGVDIRQGSPTFGQHVAVELSATNFKQLWLPPGFAHGYCTLENDCEVIYKVTDYYAPACDRGVAWDDPALGIEWGMSSTEVTLSDKDRQHPLLAELPPAFEYSSGD